MKPFAESCEQNKYVILDVLKQEFAAHTNILEIGSGTGQHAVFFAARLPHLHWQPSEQKENIPSILAWLADYSHGNIKEPINLNVKKIWPSDTFDGAFSANTTHIMDWPAVVAMFEGIGKSLKKGGTFCLYGPFNYQNKFTSESNARFDQRLKAKDVTQGIRNFEDLNRLATENKLAFKKDIEMPANNRILIWAKN